MSYATVEEFNTYINDTDSNPDEAYIAQIQEWLDTATADIDAYLGYSPTSATYTEKLNGYGIILSGLWKKAL